MSLTKNLLKVQPEANYFDIDEFFWINDLHFWSFIIDGNLKHPDNSSDSCFALDL
jgi:hypothetical protein